MDDYSALNQIKLLKQSSIVSSQLDIELLVLHLLEIDRNTLYRDNPPLTGDIINKLKELTQRREKGEPLAYLVNNIEFWNLSLYIDQNVLVPRPETELIVDIVFNIFKKSEKLFFAELGTGSGAISIALALAYPFSNGVATDIDQDALEIAIKNYTNSSKQSNLQFFCGHWWTPLESFKGKIDFAISNPPYIPKDIYEKLPQEVKNFEPKIALLGGEDGLKHIKEIIQKAPLFLKEKGWLILENHFDQGEKVKQLFIKNKFTSIEIVKDLSGIGRFTIGRYK